MGIVRSLARQGGRHEVESHPRRLSSDNDVSEVDANGYAIHNTMPGHSDFLALNLRVQYELPLGAMARRLGFYWELYNLTNRNNFGGLRQP